MYVITIVMVAVGKYQTSNVLYAVIIKQLERTSSVFTQVVTGGVCV